MSRRKLTIATRGSALALKQANWVKDKLQEEHSGLEVDLIIIKTKGDKILDVPLAKVGGKGLFVKEIEDAILDGRADLAVHSMKDVPTELPDGLFIAVTPEREDYRDALITVSGKGFKDLPENARIGTSSLRRQAQLKRLRPDFQIVSLRGNIDTRLKKLTTENMDAIVLASAGLNRMGMSDRISRLIEPETMIPAIAQGALGIEARKNDLEILDILAFLNHEKTALCVSAERAFLKTMEGGCQVPLGALARLDDGRLTLNGFVADPDGVRFFSDSVEGDEKNAKHIGASLAESLLGRGGREIMKELNEDN